MQFFPVIFIDASLFGGGVLEIGLLGCSQSTRCTLLTNLMSVGENHCHVQGLFQVYVPGTQRQGSGAVTEALSSAPLIVCLGFPPRVLQECVELLHSRFSCLSQFISPRFVTLDHFVTGFATGVGGTEERKCQACAIDEEFSFPVCPAQFSVCVAVSNNPQCLCS